MRIACHIPITLRIVGVPTDGQLEAAARALTRAVAARLTEAERLLADRHAHRGATPVEVRDAYEPGRDGAGGYAVPSYDDNGHPVAVPVRGGTRTPARRRARPFRLRVKGVMSPPELLREFVRQYYRATDEAEVDRRLPLWHWQNPRGRSATVEDADRGFIDLHVTDVTQTALDRLPGAERAEINAAADDRFRRDNALATDAKLGTGPEDELLRARWLAARADVLHEHGLRREIAALPDDVRKILFAGGRPLTPKDYGTVLGLARKLTGLTEAQRRDYLARVDSTTDDWAALDASVDRYLESERKHGSDARHTDEAASTLFGCEDLYLLWARRNELRASTAYADEAASSVEGAALVGELIDAEARLTAALARHRFPHERAFLDAMEAYRIRFRNEAATLGTDILAHYDHTLHEERGRLQDIRTVERMLAGIARTTAAGDYANAAAQRSLAENLLEQSAEAMPVQQLKANAEAADRLLVESDASWASAEQAVVTGSGGDPLVDPRRLGRDTDRRRLTGLDAQAAQRYLLDLVQKRLSDTARARAEFEQDPERVFSEPKLIEAARKHQGVQDDTIYAWIIRDHKPSGHLFSAIVLGILALVLAALVPGGGWVAAAALLANTALSTYQAVEAIDEYRQQAVEYRLSFVDQEPSLVWVSIAVAAAALDLNTTVAALMARSAKGMAALEAPLREFAAATDAETAAARLRTLTERIDAVEGLRPEVRAALRAHAAAALDLKRAFGQALGRAFTGGDPTALLKGLYYAVRTGARRFTQLRKDARLLALLGDVTGLTGAERAELELAFRRVREVADLGTNRGMDEATLMGFVDRLGARRVAGDGAFEEVLTEMRAWRPPAPGQTAAESVGGQVGLPSGELRGGGEAPPRWRNRQELDEAAAKDPEAGQASNWYETASDEQLSAREAQDPIAAEHLDERQGGRRRPFRPERPTDPAMQDRLREDLGEARAAVEAERRRLEEAGLREPATPERADWRIRRTRAGEQSVPPTAKEAAGYEGTIAVARSDIPALSGERFSGGSPRALGTYDPAHDIRPPEGVVVPQAHGHAEQALGQQLDARLSRLTAAEREAAHGRTVHIRVDQEVCSICAAGLGGGPRAGVLSRLSALHPDIVFEITADDTSAVYRLRAGVRIP
ncbi:hypothetical protein [Streptomyces sp. N50]|uniref:hypothetical protein n=1 Tax=Streptomyces sp. N50 TaxID=3081765 RepID=UPI00296233A3|nr:hypothetical protein [Streptomyces sp. N50]WOX14108.1 hypothetical protein R2B38_37075 [Streptomyces sp. N50]